MVLTTSLTGHIASILYENPENGFRVLNFVPKGSKNKVIAVGILSGAQPGQPFRLTGGWEVNRKFGRQFRFSEATPLRPTQIDALVRYLGSGLIPGIGPAMAQRIVEHFGKSTLEVLDESVGRLVEVRGIGPASLRKIKRAWKEHRGSRELALLCQELGLSMTFAPRLAKAYGAAAEKIVRENPYRLALEIKGVGFFTADGIASRLGIASHHPGRLEAGLVHTLEQAGADGHVALPESMLVERASRLLDVEPERLAPALATALDRGTLIRDEAGDDAPPLIYARPAHRTETALAAAIRKLLATSKNVRDVKPDKAVAWAEKKLGLTLAKRQREAILTAIGSKVAVITGGPGTGKTTIIRAVIEMLEVLDQQVALTAPTGRAAKRMAETTGREAMTIHRLLRFRPRLQGFEHGPDNPLGADAVIVDEASMLDQWLAARLIEAVHPAALLILVGDVDQLPSVGPGNVLCDVIESRKVPCVQLREIFRQDAAGLIVKNAHKINDGLKPELPKSGAISDFYFLREDDPVALRELICDLVVRRLPSRFSFDPVRDIQVIAPMHRGDAGVQALNDHLQSMLNPRGQIFEHGGRSFRVGDKVMQTVNDYDKDVFNGDMGFVEAVQDREIVVRFDIGPRTFAADRIDDLVLAYAISVHKSQGSEYPAVVLPLSTQHYILLQRNLLYTAVTRAKKLVVLAGSNKALFQAIRNNRPSLRYTALKNRL